MSAPEQPQASPAPASTVARIEIVYDAMAQQMTWKVTPVTLHIVTVIQIVSSMLAQYSALAAGMVSGSIVGPDGLPAAKPLTPPDGGKPR